MNKELMKSFAKYSAKKTAKAILFPVAIVGSVPLILGIASLYAVAEIKDWSNSIYE